MTRSMRGSVTVAHNSNDNIITPCGTIYLTLKSKMSAITITIIIITIIIITAHNIHIGQDRTFHPKLLLLLLLPPLLELLLAQ